MATKRQEQKAVTRANILLAAQRLFRKKGYEAVGMRDIAAATKRSTGAVFANFSDKAALFEAAMDGQAPTPANIAAFLRRVHDAAPGEPLAAEALVLRAHLIGQAA